MHIQPNSASIRRYIPLESYFQIQESQRSQSYIGMPLNMASDEGLTRRIKTLEMLEKDGFVFVGEKNWLQFYLENNRSAHFEHYYQWVNYNFENFLQLDFAISSDFDYLDYTLWEAVTDVEGMTLGFEELQNRAFLPLDELEVFIGGSEQKPDPAFLVRAFEFLHNLEYAISTINYRSQSGGELSVTGIDVSNREDPGRWELNVISGYGSEWDMTIVNGRAFS